MFCLLEVKVMGFLCFVTPILKTINQTISPKRDKTTRWGKAELWYWIPNLSPCMLGKYSTTKLHPQPQTSTAEPCKAWV